MDPQNAALEAPELTFSEGVPEAAAFGDVYFSRRGGPAETRHVFLGGNHLPEGFAQKERFVIGETGFGTGLNFLVAWQDFLRQAPAQHHLHFLSVEKFPLTKIQLQQALAAQPEFAAEAAQLLAAYPLRVPGWHRVHFDRVTLTLGFGDAAGLLRDMQAQVDAWFLDGFSPAKNPDLWSAEVFGEMARLSAPNATFATFTAAGAVKRGLQAAGFEVQKVRGFAHKREMLIGRYAPGGAFAPATLKHDTESCLSPSSLRSDSRLRATQGTPSAVVIGAGIAGCTVARALAERGIEVTLYEADRVASGASGNAAAVLYPQVTKYYGASTQWHFTAYGYMLRQLTRWKEQGLDFAFAQPGMRKYPHDDAERLAGVNTVLGLDPAIAQWDGERVWFPQGTWLNPGELCRALVTHENITLKEQTAIDSLEEIEGIVVLANAQGATELLPGWDAPLGVTAGQVSIIATDAALETIACKKGYAIPLGKGRALIGATYDRNDVSGAVTEANHETNLTEFALIFPGAHAEVTGGRTSFRASTPDRLPYVGKMQDNVYVSTGHGSRGMLSAPLAAEVIAAMITGEPMPVGRTLAKAVDPLRREGK